MKNFSSEEIKALEYDIIFPPLKQLEESRVVSENGSQASQWFQNVTSTT